MTPELVERAARGDLPGWVVATKARREHMERVAELMGSWAETLSLPLDEATRWRSVGYLHDALRDERPEALRERVPVSRRGLPGPLLHGPAAANELWCAGVLDGELLRAVAHHTVGDATFGRLGRALYAADFLEPGRDFLPAWRAELRGRMPHDLDSVVLEVVRARVTHLLECGGTVLADTIGFWNVLAEARS